MGSIKIIASIFCGATILSGGFRMLGGGKSEKSVSYILSLIMLVSIVGAVSSADFSFEIKESSLSASAVETELALSEYQAEYICRALLSEEGIKYEKIKARATKTEDGGIIINEITIKGASLPREAEKILKESGLTDTVKTE